MILIDTSVWVTHFRKGSPQLEQLLYDGDVICHPFIIGELACGNIANRQEIFSLLNELPMAKESDHDEIMSFIEKEGLMGKGIGYIDVHLLSSALLSDALIWSFDQSLNKSAFKLKIGCLEN